MEVFLFKKTVSILFLALAIAVAGCADIRSPVVLVGNDTGAASAVQIAPNLFLTAAHVVEAGGSSLKIGSHTIVVLKQDKGRDLALISVPAVCAPCAPMADVEPDVDSEVRVVGFPESRNLGAQILTTGSVQSFGQRDGTGMVTTAHAAPGNSGGGVFNEKGELVGILSAVATSCFGPFQCQMLNHLSLAIRLKTIKEFLDGTQYEVK